MNVQLKKGLLYISILAALNYKESYGYKILKNFAGLIDLSESTLYPILRRSETGNCVTLRSVEHEGRLRKMYTIPQTGKNSLCTFYQIGNNWKPFIIIERRVLILSKAMFLRKPAHKLHKLPETEVKQRLSYYEELLDDMIEDRISEAEAVEKLGDINEIAKDILCEPPLLFGKI